MKKTYILLLTFVAILITTPFRSEATENKGLNKIKAIMFDMDGVLRRGYTSLNGAAEMIAWMSKNEIPGVILTNECRYTPLKVFLDLRSMGIHLPDHWPIYTSALAVRDFFNETPITDGPIHIFVVGEKGLKVAVNQIKCKNVHIGKDFPKESNQDSETFVIFGAVDRIKITDLETAASWINAGAKVIMTCPDILDPSSKGATLVGMPGHLVHMIKMHAPCNPYSLGKPHPFMMNKAIEFLLQHNPSLKKDEILFVGDSIDTDIRMAFEHRIKSALVLTGNTRQEEANAYVIKPNFIFPSVKELWEALTHADQ